MLDNRIPPLAIGRNLLSFCVPALIVSRNAKNRVPERHMGQLSDCQQVRWTAKT